MPVICFIELRPRLWRVVRTCNRGEARQQAVTPPAFGNRIVFYFGTIWVSGKDKLCLIKLGCTQLSVRQQGSVSAAKSFLQSKGWEEAENLWLFLKTLIATH